MSNPLFDTSQWEDSDANGNPGTSPPITWNSTTSRYEFVSKFDFTYDLGLIYIGSGITEAFSFNAAQTYDSDTLTVSADGVDTPYALPSDGSAILIEVQPCTTLTILFNVTNNFGPYGADAYIEPIASVSVSPTPTPTITASPTPTPTITLSPTVTISPTSSSTPTPTPSSSTIIEPTANLKQLLRRYRDGALVATDEVYHNTKGFQYIQPTPLMVWDIHHGKKSLNFIENIVVGNKIVKAKVVIVDYCNIKIIFTTPVSGYVNLLFLDKENDIPCPSLTPTPTPTITPSITASTTPTITPTPTPVSGGSLYDITVLANSPIAYWPLNSVYGSGTPSMSDDVVSGNTLTIQTPSNVSFVGDNEGNYLNLTDGVAHTLQVYGAKLSTPITLSTNFTLEAWINPLLFATSGDGFSTIFGTSDAYNGPYGLQFNSNGVLIWSGLNSGVALNNAGDILVNSTSHIVVTSDGSGNVKLYINGVLQPPVSGVAPITETFNIDYIGANYAYDGTNHANDYSENYAGKIGNVAIYDHELTSTDVTDHYNAGITNYRYPF